MLRLASMMDKSVFLEGGVDSTIGPTLQGMVEVFELGLGPNHTVTRLARRKFLQPKASPGRWHRTFAPWRPKPGR